MKQKGGLNKFTFEFVREYFEKENYKLLSSEYNNGNEKLQVVCPNGHKWKVRFRAFKDNRCRCPYCSGKGIKLTYEYVKEYIESFGYKLLSKEYINNKAKLLIQCPNLNHSPYEVNFDSFKNKNSRCPHCTKNHHYTYYEVKRYIENFGYELLSKQYMNCKEYIRVSCPFKHEYDTTFDSFKNKERRCPICNISKGEQRIMNWLDKNNIKYIYDQPYFDDLRGVNNGFLRPDFILLDYKMWIEYDGEFHYENKMNENDYNTLKIHDEIKDEYANKNGWKLIRIPYWEIEEIENILRGEFDD